jgi:hypothetical protein
VLAAFSESAENQAGTAALVQNGIWDRSEAAAQVARLYDTVFGPPPDVAGLTFWKDGLEDGTAPWRRWPTPSPAAPSSAPSTGRWTTAASPTPLREHAGPAGRPAGLDFWTGALDAGAPARRWCWPSRKARSTSPSPPPAIGGENPAEFGILFA